MLDRRVRLTIRSKPPKIPILAHTGHACALECVRGMASSDSTYGSVVPWSPTPTSSSAVVDSTCDVRMISLENLPDHLPRWTCSTPNVLPSSASEVWRPQTQTHLPEHDALVPAPTSSSYLSMWTPSAHPNRRTYR